MFRRKKNKMEIEADRIYRIEPIRPTSKNNELENMSNEEKQMLMDLYVEYRAQGMAPSEAMSKAKHTVACFKGGAKV